jgi:hypothetical protein
MPDCVADSEKGMRNMTIDNQWKRFCPGETTSDLTVFVLEHFALLGTVLGALVSGIAWAAVASTGSSVMRIVNHEWWGIFSVLLMLATVAVGHELIHFGFSNWAESRFICVPQHCSFAVQIRGEFSKWRYVMCALAPTIGITCLVFPAFRFDSPYLMAAVVLNLSGSGLDWITAVLAITVLSGDRILLDGENVYVSID